MKITKFITIILISFCGQLFAADFTPTPMTISVQPQLEYNFDGTSLEIPFTLTGKSGAVWLVVNTHGQAENIVNVRNGNLGWHYVNKIDTTIYISERFERQPGENTIVWDGRDENGNLAEPGTYDYYLWGYDDKSDGQLASDYLRIGFGWFQQCTQLYEKDTNGLSLSKPLLMGNIFFKDYYRFIDDIYREGTHFRWTIGSDPMDKNLIQTSLCAMYYPMVMQAYPYDWGTHVGVQLNPDWVTYGGAAFDPKDYNIFYHPSYKVVTKDVVYDEYFSVLKWTFVPYGEAILDSEWGGFNKFIWESPDWGIRDGCIANDNYLFVTDSADFSLSQWNKLKCIDYNGELIFNKEFSEWFISDNRLGKRNNSIDKIYPSKHSENLLMIGTLGCMHQMINPQRLYEDPDDETDMLIFTNSNGDYFLDNGWQDNLEYPWYCVNPFDSTNIYRNSISIDSNNFNLIIINNYGIVSFGLSTQDGTGIGYMSFHDDAPDKCNIGGQICDSGSAYDGIYFSRDINSEDINGSHGIVLEESQTYYVAFDSAHGLITNNPAVQEQNPLQFKVSQNTPNPFNPSTTISFSVPEKSNVTIDIYNIMGQKIKTLINGPMSAGEHSVKWDANGCSAGVYFYKIKAGKFEKTMKMMLVR